MADLARPEGSVLGVFGAGVGDRMALSNKARPRRRMVSGAEQRTLGCGRRLDSDHDVSILIRPVEAERRAPARPNVSMTIMRPPQHGQGTKGWADRHRRLEGTAR